MTQDQIYQELGIAGSNEETKRAILGNILTTVDGRFVGIVDDILSEDQAKQLGAMESIEGVKSWIADNLPESVELYDSILRDHIEELKGQLQQIG